MMTFDLNQLSQTLGTAYGLIGLFIFIWTLIVTTWALFKLPSLTSALKELPPLIIRLEKVVDGLKPTIDQVTSAVSNSTKDIEQVAKQIDAVSVQLGKISDITRQRTDYEPAPQPSFEGQPPPEASAGEQQADDATVEDHWPELSSTWANVKGELNKIIDRISDGRVRRKYAVRKDDYAYIIELLLLDELIYSAQANGATYLNDLYLARRNRRNPVSEEEIRKARQAAEMFWVHD